MAIHQPHDHLFKRVFGAPAEAASFLQARLPPSLRRSLRWSTLKRRAASFVAPDLRGTASDLLFDIRYAEPSAAQAPLWLYLLFEHQSTADTAAAGRFGEGRERRRGRHEDVCRVYHGDGT